MRIIKTLEFFQTEKGLQYDEKSNTHCNEEIDKRRAIRMNSRTFTASFAILLAFLFLALPAYAVVVDKTDLESICTTTIIPNPNPPPPLIIPYTYCGDSSGATVINDNGQIAGWSMLDTSNDNYLYYTSDTYDAFFYDSTLSSPVMVDLGTLNSSIPPVGPSPQYGLMQSYPTAINNFDQVVGWSYYYNSSTCPTVDCGTNQHAFLATGPDPLTMQDLGTLGGTQSGATDINDNGQAVGWSYDSSGRQRAFLWTSGPGMQDLGTICENIIPPIVCGDPSDDAAYASAISNNLSQLQAVGWSYDASGNQHAVLWTAIRTITDLASPSSLGGNNSSATAINVNGQVVGISDVATANEYHAFFYDSTLSSPVMEDLGTLDGGTKSYPAAINNATPVQVAGWSNLASGSQHAFLWTSAQGMTDLGTLPGGTTSSATAINDNGWVVGWSDDASGNRHAFVWITGEGMTDLGTLDGGATSYALAINNSGQVVGQSAYSPFYQHAIVWTVTTGATTTNTLTVNSFPDTSGVPITVSQGDTDGNRNGVTPFTRTYDSSASITLTAPATEGSKSFSSWSNCASTSGLTCTVDMSAATTVTANYSNTTNTLTVQSSPDSGVTITANQTDINSKSSGSTTFTLTYNVSTTSVILTAPATESSKAFVNWTGPCASTSGLTCTVLLNANKTVTANYITPYTLTVQSVNPTSGVTISVSPTDLNNLTDGTTLFTRTYLPTTMVTLTASATNGASSPSPFNSWTGCDTTNSVARTCSVTMNANKTVTANYTTVPTHILTVQSSPNSGVTINANQADNNSNISGATTFTLTYNASTTNVVLTAPATDLSSDLFSSWTGCDSTNKVARTCTVNNMSADKTVTAIYTASSKRYSISGTVTAAVRSVSVKGVTVTLSGPENATTTTNGKGAYSFTKLPNGGPYTVTPSKTGHTFTPPSLDVTVSGSNQPGVNFTEN